MAAAVLKVRAVLLSAPEAAKDFLFDQAAKIRLENARHRAANGALGPPLNRRRRNHPLQEAVKLIVRLDDIAVAPAVRCRHQQTKADMGAPDPA